MARPILLGKINPTSLIDKVQEQILLLVKQGGLTVDDALPPERDLAVQLGISRTTVREALRGLADRGILQAHQGAGWFLRPRTDAMVDSLAVHYRLSNVSFEQLTEVRQVLEPAIVVAAVARADDQDLDALDQALQSMVDAADEESFLGADMRFHVLLAESTRNVLFELAIKPVMAVLEETRGVYLRTPGRREQVIEAHRRVLESIRGRDAAAAAIAMSAHLSSFIRDVTEDRGAAASS